MENLEAIQKRVRAQDPISSVMAAERSMFFSGTHKERILRALKSMKYATAKDIGWHAGLSVEQVDRRLPELERDGLARLVERAGIVVIRDGYRMWRLGSKKI